MEKIPESLYQECEPRTIIADLKLGKIRYFETAKYGHFGNIDFPWEK